MQILIDKPEDFYEALKKTDEMSSGLHSEKTLMSVIYSAVAKGTPFPEEPVLDKIRAEIEAIIGERGLDDYDFCSGLICARKIIDKYLAEMEKAGLKERKRKERVEE